MRTQIAGIPCIVEVTSYTPYQPARLDGAMEDAEEACSGEIGFEVFDMTGYRAKWLEAKLTQADIDGIFDEYESTLEEN